jgi:hypothetical protein
LFTISTTRAYSGAAVVLPLQPDEMIREALDSLFGLGGEPVRCGIINPHRGSRNLVSAAQEGTSLAEQRLRLLGRLRRHGGRAQVRGIAVWHGNSFTLSRHRGLCSGAISVSATCHPSGRWRFAFRGTAQRSLDDPVQLSFNHSVTLACNRLEAGAIDDGDPAVVVSDETRRLKEPCGQRHGRSACAEHPAKELVGDRELVRADAVVAHQQPPAEALLGAVEPVARRRVGDLAEQDLEVIVHQRSSGVWAGRKGNQRVGCVTGA